MVTLNDANMNVNMNVTCLIDANGDAVERYDYEPYGQVAVFDDDWSADGDGASDVDNAILFAGYRHDAGSALYHVRNRMLHPTLGRWLQRDPAGYVDGMSAYEYGRGAPTIAVDPFGLETCNERYSNCMDDAQRFNGDCWKRMALICGAVCAYSARWNPACAVCLAGYAAACESQHHSDIRYCYCRYLKCLANDTSRCRNIFGTIPNPGF